MTGRNNNHYTTADPDEGIFDDCTKFKARPHTRPCHRPTLPKPHQCRGAKLQNTACGVMLGFSRTGARAPDTQLPLQTGGKPKKWGSGTAALSHERSGINVQIGGLAQRSSASFVGRLSPAFPGSIPALLSAWWGTRLRSVDHLVWSLVVCVWLSIFGAINFWGCLACGLVAFDLYVGTGAYGCAL